MFYLMFPTFLLSVPLLVVIWSYPEQGYDSTTGYFVWLMRSPGTVCHWTFFLHLHYQRSKTCSRHLFSHSYTLLTKCFAEYEQRTLYGALVVTLAMLLRLINCRFIIIIIIIIIIICELIWDVFNNHYSETGNLF